MSDELVVKLKRLREFLDGSGELSLQTFGGEVRARPKYWWRKYLTRIDDAISRIESLQAKVAELQARLAKYEDKVLPIDTATQIDELHQMARAFKGSEDPPKVFLREKLDNAAETIERLSRRKP